VQPFLVGCCCSLLGGATSQLSQRHFEQSIKSVAEVEEQLALKEYREENYMSSDDPIPTTPEDVEQYYRLSTAPEDQGLFRVRDTNDDEIRQQMEAEQVGAKCEPC
jgi:hypothetical protein